MKILGLLAICLAVTGCATTALQNEVNQITYSDIPRELQKVSYPIYRVEPPDILLIDAINNIRPPHDTLRAGDRLLIQLGNPEPFEPIAPGVNALETQYRLDVQARSKIVDADYQVQSDGTIDLGPIYGSVQVAGKTLNEARKAIEEHLKGYEKDEQGQPVGLKAPQVAVSMPDVAGKQAISGEHLVRPDGTVSVGVYGSVYVAGMTLAEVKSAVEEHLSKFIEEPEVNVDVLAYNSKVYYVITDGGGYGEQVIRLPCTGNETVLDAIARVEGLSEVSSKTIWVARPAPAGTGGAQIMDVHWSAIAAEGITTTNYQLLPGDRIYIKADKLIATDNMLAKLLTPFERIFGFTLLGHGTVRSLQFGHLFGQNQGGGSGF